jgi:DHA3 family macrolide efflux protein-like MFS transporter
MGNYSFRYLVVGQSLANGGDLLYIVGLMTFLYQLSDSALYMTLVPFVVTISKFMCGLLVPMLFDRYKLKWLLVTSQLWKTALLFLLGVFVAFFVTKQTLLFLFLFVSLISFLDGVAHPARNALIPRLVKAEELVKANSMLAVVDQTIQFGGWALGGVLAAFLSSSAMIGLTFVFFTISTICMVKVNEERGTDEVKEMSNRWQSLKEGWVYIVKQRWLRYFHIMILAESMAGAVWIAAILYIYVQKNLNTDTAWWGYINASFFAGLIIGGMVVWSYAEVVRNKMFFSVVGGYVGTAVMTFLFGINHVALFSLLLSFVYGLFEQWKAIGMQTMLQEYIPSLMLPKIYAAQQSVITISFGIMSVVNGWLVDIYGTKFVFLISAGLLCLSVLLCFTMGSYFQKMKERRHVILEKKV